MMQIAQEIVTLLDSEIRIYEDLLELSKKKKDIIIKNEVAELDKIVRLEQNMIFDIGQLEKKREETVDRLCLEIDIKREDATISNISKKIGNDCGKRLLEQQKKTQEVLGELKSINDTNGMLIRQSLEYIDFSINTILDSNMQSSSLYDDVKSDGKDTANKRQLFDAKV